MWWFLAREVLKLRGKINRQLGFVLDDKIIMPDLYFYRDPQEQEKDEEVEAIPVGQSEWANSALKEDIVSKLFSYLTFNFFKL